MFALPCCPNCESSSLFVKMVILTFYIRENIIGQIQFCETCLNDPLILKSQIIEDRIKSGLPEIAAAVKAEIENLKKGFVFKGFENNGN